MAATAMGGISPHWAKHLLWTENPARFCREALGLDLDPWQAEFLLSPSRKVLLNCHRQSGKSTITAALALHQVAYWGNSLVLILTPSMRQSQEVKRKVDEHIARWDHGLDVTAQATTHLELANGSRVVCLPSKEESIRGYSDPAIIIEDESSRVPDSAYRAVRPMLSVSEGRHILLSTPFGKRGHFYDEWHSDANWLRILATADQCPRISAEFLAEERAALGDAWYRQEYMCEFLDAVGGLFPTELVEALWSDSVLPLFASGDTGAITEAVETLKL